MAGAGLALVATSFIGTVKIAAGSGTKPLELDGNAYLAGPYKGAPLSMAIVTPVVIVAVLCTCLAFCLEADAVSRMQTAIIHYAPSHLTVQKGA